MGYGVTFVRDDDLPEEQAWAVALCGGELHMFLKATATSPAVIAEAWAACRRLNRNRVPEQRASPGHECLQRKERVAAPS